MQRQLRPMRMQRVQVGIFERHHTALHVDMCRDGLALALREMLVDGQVIVDAADAQGSFEYITYVGGLLD